MKVTDAEKYVSELFEREYPYMIDDDGEHMIVEFSESDLEEAFNAGVLAGREAMREESATLVEASPTNSTKRLWKIAEAIRAIPLEPNKERFNVFK